MSKLSGFWTTAQLVDATGLSQNTIRYHCLNGRLKAVAQWTETQWLVPEKDAKAFIQAYAPRRGRS